MTRRKGKHTRTRTRLERLLEGLADGVTNQRWEGIPADDHLRGAPDLTIEVLSPSNTASEILDNERLCLENGSKEFWVVDPERRQAKVSTLDGHRMTYRAGQRIPVAMFGAEVDIDSIFA